jgi:hypothetical protein
LIDTNPHWGIGDGSKQPFDEKIAKRVAELTARACKLGDTFACATIANDDSPIPQEPCGASPRWAR